MEKTLEFAINEALESGRRSAMPQFLEMELREKIAREIEDLNFSFIRIEGEGLMKVHPDCYKCGEPALTNTCESANKQNINGAKRIFANIARGKK